MPLTWIFSAMAIGLGGWFIYTGAPIGDIVMVVSGFGGAAIAIAAYKFITAKLSQTKLTPTIAWLNATYALITAMNSGDRNFIGGQFRDPINIFHVRVMLRNWWSIKNKDDALEILKNLASEQHNTVYRSDIHAFEEHNPGLFSLSPEKFIEALNTYDEPVRPYLKFLYEGYQKFGENACLGWDLSRGVYVSGSCYVACFMSRDEALEHSLTFGKKLQQAFGSWDDFLESYLYGCRFWQENFEGKIAGEYKQRLKILEKQKKDPNGPYAQSWTTPLVRDWV